MKYVGFLLGTLLLVSLTASISAADGHLFDFVEELSVAKIGVNSSALVYKGQINTDRLLSGWAVAEHLSTPKPRIWAIGRTAEFLFYSEIQEPKDILFRCRPLKGGNDPAQEIEIFVNGEKVGQETLSSGDGDYKISVPAGSVKIGRNMVRFEFSRVCSPHDLNSSSSDTRPLAANFAVLLVLPESLRGRVPGSDPVRVVSMGQEKAIFQEYPSRVIYSCRAAENAKLDVKCMVPRTVLRSKVDSVTLKLLVETENGEKKGFEKKMQPAGPGEKPEWMSFGDPPNELGSIARFTFICDASPADPATGAALVWKGTLTGQAPPEPETAKKPFDRPESIILVSIDTLRADSLKCYGYDKDTSPNIDAFAADSTLFERCYSHAPSTLPSHGTMLTSLYPDVHNGRYRVQTAVRRDVPTLPEMLAEVGYKTAAFTGGGQLDRAFGIDRGFGLYEQVEERFGVACEAALKWIDDNRKDPFFLFLHTYDVHTPYDPEQEYARMFVSPDYSGPLGKKVDRSDVEKLEQEESLTAEDIAYARAMYDAEIRSMDIVFEGFLSRLKEMGLYDDALILFTSDHGEEFGEHGVVAMHSHTVYNELLSVPMIVKWPGNVLSGKRVKNIVALGDILPTVIDAAGLEPYAAAIGSSLLPVAMDQENEQRCYAQMEGSLRECLFEGNQKAILNHNTMELDGHKQIPREELFDLEKDPKEQNSIADQNPIVADYFDMEMRRIRRDIDKAKRDKAENESEKVRLSEDLEKRLKGLGYAK